MKRTFLFATIASILSINAYAVSATVTSKDYVDTMDYEVFEELDSSKQNKIPEAGVNAEENGGGVSVVTYTEDGDGVLGERGICNAGLYGDGDCLRNYLMTVDVLDETRPIGTAGTVPVYDSDGELGSAERGIYDGSNGYNSSTDADKLVTAAALNNLPTTTVTYKTCTEWSGTPHTDANCLLWNLSDKPVYGNCTSHSDCSSLDCDFEHTGQWAGCFNGRCDCIAM